MTYTRLDGRTVDQIRNTKITPNISPYAEGSALIEVGGTKVICTASVEDKVPMFLRNKGLGWVTAEYAMLPRATNTRTQRETQRPSGRTQEIQRLIGRSLRAIVDTRLLGERHFTGRAHALAARARRPHEHPLPVHHQTLVRRRRGPRMPPTFMRRCRLHAIGTTRPTIRASRSGAMTIFICRIARGRAASAASSTTISTAAIGRRISASPRRSARRS